MRFLIDFFPIGLFVAAYKLHDIYTATAVLMAATLVQTGIIYAIDRKLQTLQKVTLVLVIVFGVLGLAGAWIGTNLLRFTFQIFDRFPYMIAGR